MRRRPAILEIAWGKNGTGKWCVMAGWHGTWFTVSNGHHTKAECMKAVTAAAKKLAGHQQLHAALSMVLKNSHPDAAP